MFRSRLPWLVLIPLLCLLPLTAPAAEEPDDDPTPWYRRAEAERKAAGLAEWRASQKMPSTNQEQYDVDHYELDLTIDPNTNTIGGTLRMDATVVDGPLAMVELDLDLALTVSGVTAGGVATTFTHAADLLSIDLDQSYSIGQSFSVVVSYAGAPDEGHGAFGFSSNAGQPLVWSLSEPYGARTWWPCKDTPSDKAATARIRLTVPDGLIAVSNGELQSTTSNAGWTSFDWLESHPIVTYLVSLAIHPYTEQTVNYTPLGGGSMPVTVWSYPSEAGSALNAANVTVDQLVAFREVFGEYPFVDEKYGQAQFPWGGGMEHQTATSLCCWIDWLMAHELTHQWYGDGVTCHSFSHIWLNEGFATYGEAIWAEDQGGFEALRSNILANQYFGPGTIFVPPNELDSASRIFNSNLSYNKASWVVHMLRGIMGDTLFKQFMSDWSYSPAVGYGTATTEDLQALAESVSGRDLSNFFANWIYNEYFPTYAYGWSAVDLGGSWDVTVDLEQLQSHALYEMPVQLRVNTTGGDVDFTVENDAFSQSFVLKVGNEPTGVQLDPDDWILKAVENKLEGPSFHNGILLVNGVDWSVYGTEITSAYADSAFSGYMDFDFWDAFPAPGGGYLPQLPAPRGNGNIPPEILGEYSTVIWVGNDYQGDLAVWTNAAVMSYLRQGGNLLLMSRRGQNFLTPVRAGYPGIRWAEAVENTIGGIQALHPSLVDMTPTGTQSFTAVFETSYDQPEAITLFTTNAFGTPRSTGVWRQPTAGGTLRPSGAHFAHIAGRPYRWVHSQLRDNVQVILTELFSEDTATDVETPSAGLRVALHAPVPNPFNPRVQLSYELAQSGHARLTVYDLRGRAVRTLFDAEMPAGAGSILWDGSDASGRPTASGVYSIVLEANGQRSSRKATLIR